MNRTNLELRDPADARQFLTQGLWWQRIMPVRAEQVANILDWALAIAAEGDPLPPLGFIADLGHMVFGATTGVTAESVPLAGWPTTLVRVYEDYVLGKLFADTSFERGSDALRPYARPSFTPGRPLLEAVMDLTSRIHKEFRYDAKATTLSTPLGEVLQQIGRAHV